MYTIVNYYEFNFWTYCSGNIIVFDRNYVNINKLQTNRFLCPEKNMYVIFRKTRERLSFKKQHESLELLEPTKIRLTLLFLKAKKTQFNTPVHLWKRTSPKTPEIFPRLDLILIGCGLKLHWCLQKYFKMSRATCTRTHMHFVTLVLVWEKTQHFPKSIPKSNIFHKTYSEKVTNYILVPQKYFQLC